MKLNLKISTSTLLLTLVMMIMANNVIHSAMLYLFTNHEMNEGFIYLNWLHRPIFWYSLFINLILDLGVITGLKVGDKKLSKGFAIMILLVNLLFWNVLDDLYNFGTVARDSMLMSKFISKLLFSIVFSYSIHRFSTLYVELKLEKELLSDIKADNEVLNIELENASQRLIELENTIAQNETLISDYCESNKDLKHTELLYNSLLKDHDTLQDDYNKLVQYQAKNELEKAKRTLYKMDGSKEIQSSYQALNAVIGHITEEEQKYSKKIQKEEIEKFESVLV